MQANQNEINLIQDQNDPVIRTLSPCYDRLTSKFEIFNIFFFEFGSMILFSYCVIAFGGITKSPGLWIVWGGMAISIAVGATFGFGHVNPAVTFACMIKKQGRVSILNGCLLLLSQFMGAFAGTYIAWGVYKQLLAPFPDIHSGANVWKTFGVQIFGSCVFVLCILILVSTDTQPTVSNIKIWASIPLCLIAVCILLDLGLGTNPAQALAFQVAFYSFHPDLDNFNFLSKIWSVVIGASIGGILAGVIFEFVYRRFCRAYKTQLTLKQINKSQIREKFMDSDKTENRSVHRKTQIQIQ